MERELPKKKCFLVIAGNIGSGKTTLTRMLAEHFGWEPHFEPVVNNPYLEDFYKDMARWSFPLQIFFLNSRFNAHRVVDRSSQSAIQDRSIYEDAHVFARSLFDQGLMSERDYENYLHLFQSMTSFLQAPTLVVFLNRSVPKLMERIRLRGRDFEKGLTVDYLERLNNYYQEWYCTYDMGKSIMINTDDMDFQHRQEDFLTIVSKIEEALEGIDMAGHTSSHLSSHQLELRLSAPLRQ